MSALKLPTQSNCARKPNFLIMVFDGTESMQGEYHLMLQAYYNVFQDEIQRESVYAIQFGTRITPLEPFQNAALGNLNHAYQQVLHKLEENLNADITICVVSGGIQDSNISSELAQQINNAKKQYQIQFTSIAVGQDYSFALFQQFRDYFHNGSPSCPVVQFVDRSNKEGQQACKQNFMQKFQIVKSLLNQQRVIQLNQQVQQFLLSYQAQPQSMVLSDNEKLETVDEQKIQFEHIEELVQKSCQQFMVQQQNSQFKDTAKQAGEIKKEATYLLKRINTSTSLHKEQVSKFIAVVEKDLEILDDIGEGRLQLNKLSDAEKTKLQESFNPKSITEQKKVFEEQLVNLINQKSRSLGEMILLSYLSDYIEDAIKEQTSKEIMRDLLDTKKKSLKTIQNYAIRNTELVEKFIDSYIKVA